MKAAKRVTEIQEYYFSRKLKEIAKRNAAGEQIISLAIGSPDLPPSKQTIEKLCEVSREPDAHGYQPTVGTPELRAAMAGFYRRWYGVALDAQTEILPLIGSKEGILHTTLAFVDPGDKVLVPDPGYPTYTSLSKILGAEIVNYPLREDNDWQPDFDLLEKLAADPKNTLLILCSPHNPSGRVWTKEELTRIAEIAVKNNLIVVADEIHHDLIMPSSTHTVFETISDEVAARTITCTSASKSFNLAGTQFSNIIVSNPELRTRLEKRLQARETTSCNPISFKACELAYSKGGAWLDACIKAVDDNQKLVLDFFATKHPRVKLAPITGTYLQWLDFRDLGLTPEELDQLLQFEAQVFFTDGVFFGEAAQGFKRWNLAAPRVEIEEALDRLDAVLTAHGF